MKNPLGDFYDETSNHASKNNVLNIFSSLLKNFLFCILIDVQDF